MPYLNALEVCSRRGAVLILVLMQLLHHVVSIHGLRGLLIPTDMGKYRIYSRISRPVYKPTPIPASDNLAKTSDPRISRSRQSATNEYPGSVHCHPTWPAQTPITAPQADAPRMHADVRRCVHLPQCKPLHWYADTAAAVCVWSCLWQAAGAY